MSTGVWECWTLHMRFRVALCIQGPHLPINPTHAQLWGLELSSLSLAFPSPKQADPLHPSSPTCSNFGQAALPTAAAYSSPPENQMQRQHSNPIKKRSGLVLKVRLG